MRAFEGLLFLAMAVGATACNVVAVVPAGPAVASRAALEVEVDRGYEAYSAALSPWGTWEQDRTYGVRWCPRADVIGGEEPFQPYLSRGRWSASDAPIGGAPAGSPVWVSEDPDTWGEITTRHGWWVHGSRWCWIPGVTETPGRVTWRWGDDFVGWAPEAPDCAPYDDVEYEALDWAFTVLGTLLDERPDKNQLSGEARETARSATSRGAGDAGRTSRVGPPAKSIGDARTALARYAEAHAVTIKQASAQFAVEKSSSGSSGSSSAKASSAKHKSESSSPALMPADPLLPEPLYLADGAPRLPHGGPASAAVPIDGRAGSGASALASGHEPARGGAHTAHATPAAGARIAAPSPTRTAGTSSYTYTYRSRSSSGGKSSGRSHSSSRSSGRSHR